MSKIMKYAENMAWAKPAGSITKAGRISISGRHAGMGAQSPSLVIPDVPIAIQSNIRGQN